MFFSIAIPCYEMKGRGVEFLENTLNILESQTFKDFEVVISDHSINNLIYDLCHRWKDRLNINYFKNSSNIGNSSHNINKAIENCRGEWIKILFQDDFLYSKESLMDIKKFITDDTEWIATACQHSNDGINFYREFHPSWNNNIKEGINTISSPSVITIRNGRDLYFDPEFIWLMDVDFYYTLWLKYGEPRYLNKVNVVNRTWESSLSNTISNVLKKDEIKKIKNKYV